MRRIEFTKRPDKYLRALPTKHLRQILAKVEEFAVNPEPSDSKMLRGYDLWRADVGEYRIVYDYTAVLLNIVLIGKRNDGDVYRRLDRLAR